MKPSFWFAAVVSFALWWGGLTVYASVVVPIGSDVFSSTEQGFVTQRVTHWINVFAAVWLASSLPAARAERRMLILWCLQLLCLASLVPLHWSLDGMLDAPARSVIEGERFYNLHRLYLWITTAQWGAGLAFAWLGVKRLPEPRSGGWEVRR